MKASGSGSGSGGRVKPDRELKPFKISACALPRGFLRRSNHVVAPALLCWCVRHSESARRAFAGTGDDELWRTKRRRTKGNRAVLHTKRRSRAASTLIRAAKAAARSQERRTSRAVNRHPRVENSREAERNNSKFRLFEESPPAKGGLLIFRGNETMGGGFMRRNASTNRLADRSSSGVEPLLFLPLRSSKEVKDEFSSRCLADNHYLS